MDQAWDNRILLRLQHHCNTRGEAWLVDKTILEVMVADPLHLHAAAVVVDLVFSNPSNPSNPSIMVMDHKTFKLHSNGRDQRIRPSRMVSV